MQAFSKAVEEDLKFKKFGKKHQPLVTQITLGKQFPFGTNSQLKQFVENQSKDRPFWLQPFLMNEDGKVEIITEEKPILKHHFKFKNKSELTKKDFEYHLLKNRKTKNRQLSS